MSIRTPNLGRNGGVGLGAMFDAHMAADFTDKSVVDTMPIMGPDPMVMYVPTAGGVQGWEPVSAFY